MSAAAARPSYVVAVDSGGTFTDCVAIRDDGVIARGKAASTPADYSLGVLSAVERVAEDLDMTVEALLANAILFAHGTTVATNALLTRNGSTTGILTTLGHEDAILIGRTYQKVAGLTEDERADVAALQKAVPIVPRERMIGVAERIDRDGVVVAPLDLASVRAAVEQLVEQGVDAIAVCLLWAFRNPVHEQAIRDLIEREHPDLVVSLSHELAPVLGEYERGVTTMLNAYLTRRTSSYMERLTDALSSRGFAATPVVMQSSGGVQAMDRAKTRPVALLTSGPAGGVKGAQVLGGQLGYRNIITTDVGGTSFDVGLVVDGQPQYIASTTLEQYEMALPVIDIATIGAGGGSIAWIEAETGVLRVGPQSAGAEPGPACYGLGGTEPTVTDANVVLGRLNPEFFLGGRRGLDPALSHEAVRRLADRLEMSVPDVACGIVAIADAHMADLVRKVTVERGFDPREFVLFAFGGAGPVHACAYGFAAQCSKVLVPAAASEFSAFGIAGSDVMVIEERSDPMLAPFDPDRWVGIFAELEAVAAEQLRANGVTDDQMSFNRFARLRYRGQVHEVETPVPTGPLGSEHVSTTLQSFERIYEQKYGRGTTFAHAGLQAITFRVDGLARLHVPALASERAATNGSGASKGSRPVCWDTGGGYVDTAIYAAELLEPGARVAGPAIVEAVDTTIVIHPGQVAERDDHGNIGIVLAGDGTAA